MSFPASFLFAVTLATAGAAGAVAEVRNDAAQMAELRQAAGRASSIGAATLTLAADTVDMAQLRAAAGRASSIGPAILTLAAR